MLTRKLQARGAAATAALSTGISVLHEDRVRRVPFKDKDLLPGQCGDEHLLGALRIMARQYRGGSAKSAEKLVELTLETAIEEYGRRPADMSLFRWLRAIMQRHLN